MVNPFDLPVIATKLTGVEPDDLRMTGTERWPTRGKLLNEKQIKHLISQCQGMYRYWNCLEKAMLVCRFRGCGFVAIGACMVISRDKSSSYGHYHNPPYEFHAWWQKHPGIGQPVIDIALPGLIEKGLATSDHLGPFLIGRRPVIVAGRPPKWVAYNPVEYLS